MLPFASESYATATFGFTILRFDHDASTDVVYLEDNTDKDAERGQLRFPAAPWAAFARHVVGA